MAYKDRSHARTNRITLWLNDDEYAVIDAQAQYNGMQPGCSAACMRWPGHGGSVASATTGCWLTVASETERPRYEGADDRPFRRRGEGAESALSRSVN